MKLILTTDDGEVREQWYLIAWHTTATPADGWDVTQPTARRALTAEISDAVIAYRGKQARKGTE